MECILNSLGVELMVIDGRGRILFVNDEAVRGLGFSRKAIVGRSVGTLMKPEVGEKAWREKFFNRLKTSRRAMTWTVERMAARDRVQTIEVSATYVTAGCEGYVLSVGRDVTEQVASQNRLQDSVDLYHSLCEGAGDAILKLDMGGKVVYANKAARCFFGKALAEGSLKALVPPSAFAKMWAPFADVKARKVQQRFEGAVLAEGGDPRPVEVTVSPILEKGRITAFHTMLRDISQQKQLEELVRESEGMKAIQYFAQGTARELKHPMMGIARRVEGMIRKYKGRDFEFIGFKEFSDIMASLEQLLGQVKQCYSTTEKLEILNKQPGGRERREVCDVNDVVRDVLRFSSQELKAADIHCRTRIPADLPKVLMGEIELNHVVGNVVRNAIQAMPSGGQLTVAAGYIAASKQVRLVVRDEGVGIPEEDLKFIFEPFFSTKQGARQSAGLGLSIVYALLKASRGEIRIYSRLRSGTRVEMLIPADRRLRLKG